MTTNKAKTQKRVMGPDKRVKDITEACYYEFKRIINKHKKIKPTLVICGKEPLFIKMNHQVYKEVLNRIGHDLHFDEKMNKKHKENISGFVFVSNTISENDKKHNLVTIGRSVNGSIFYNIGKWCEGLDGEVIWEKRVDIKNVREKNNQIQKILGEDNSLVLKPLYYVWKSYMMHNVFKNIKQ